MRAQFITAEEVQQILSVSRSKSYQIIRELNKELKSMGYHTIAGKCPIQFFKPYNGNVILLVRQMAAWA